MTHFEYMEQAGQITIDDILSIQQSDQEPIQISSPVYEVGVGDSVIIRLDQSDAETYNYFKYYHPHLINKAGRIVDSKRLKNGRIYLVNVLGELHWFYESELM